MNIVGSLVLGAVLRASMSLHPQVALLVGTGFCGALTTFGGFGYETMRLLEERSLFEAGLNVVGSLVLADPSEAELIRLIAAAIGDEQRVVADQRHVVGDEPDSQTRIRERDRFTDRHSFAEAKQP